MKWKMKNHDMVSWHLHVFSVVVALTHGTFVIYEESSISDTYIKYIRPLTPQLCKQECNKLNDCHSVVYKSYSLECFLHAVDCSTAIIHNATRSMLGCFTQVRGNFLLQI